MASKIYNGATWFWHRVLKRPVKYAVAFDNKVKRPQLTVVFLHGISADSDTWKVTLRQFNSDKELSRVRLIALDLLGFGRSLKADWLQYDSTEYNTALDATLKSLKVKSPVVLIGHSMGSLIAANYAANYDYHAKLVELILISPPVLMADDLAKLPDKVYTKTYGSLHKIAEDVPAAEVLAKIVQRFSSFRSQFIKTTAFERSMQNIILSHDHYRTFVKLHLPTLIIHGHFDPLVLRNNLKRVARGNPRYIKYVSVIGQHDISVGKRAKMLTEIKKILKQEQLYEDL